MPSQTSVATVARGAGLRRVGAGVPSWLGAVLSAVGVTALLLLLTRGLFLDGDRLVADFANDSWYIRHQAAALSDGYAPSLFLTSDTSAFYPIFAFYGGTLFAFAGAVALVTGNAHTAQAIVYLLALASAYGGWYWLARQAGVRHWLAHAPAIAYVTAPYVITNIYARQDLVETVATAAMPLMVAAAISVGRADRLRAGPVAALAVAVIAFTGSHNLTLLYGTAYLALLAGLVLATVPAARRVFPWHGALRILAVVAPATAVNAWFLLPDLVYSHGTAIAQRTGDARDLLRADPAELSLGHLFTPGRPDDGEASGYTLPVLVSAWALLAAVTARVGHDAPWRRLVLLLAGVVVGIAVLMSQAHAMADLPSPFVLLQTGARLTTYALFGVCGMLVAALALRRPAPWLTALLGAALLIGVLQAGAQMGKVVLNGEPYRLPFDNSMTFGLGDYADARLPIVVPPRDAPLMMISHANVSDGRAEVTASGAPNDMFITNLMGPAEMLRVEGAHVVARWAARTRVGWHPRWYLVLALDRDVGSTRHRVVISQARTFPIVAGRMISVLGLLGLFGLLVSALWRARPPRHAPRPHRRSAAAP